MHVRVVLCEPEVTLDILPEFGHGGGEKDQESGGAAGRDADEKAGDEAEAF